MTAPPAESSLLWKWVQHCRDPFQRAKDQIREEILSFQGLMPLLMQQRNGRRWTADERAELAQHLRHLQSLSPYLLALLAPGSFVLLPFLAWWPTDAERNETKGGRGDLVSASCSPTAHDQNVLVRRAHSRINQADLWKARQASLEGSFKSAGLDVTMQKIWS